MDSILKYKRCEEDDFYKVLGCDENSTMEQILSEYKASSLLCHPDKNPDDQDAVIRFQKLLKAKEILTDPEKRCLYDKWRRSGFCIPFDQFANLNKASHTSVHWATKRQKDLMIEDKFDVQNSCESSETIQPRLCRNVAWERDPASEILKKFRNYEI